MIISLLIFCDKTIVRKSDLGPAWVQQVKKNLPRDYAAPLRSKRMRQDLSLLAELFILMKNPSLSDIESFTAWYRNLPMSNYLEASELPPSLQERLISPLKNASLLSSLLLEWQEHYFKNIDSGIINSLVLEAKAKHKLAAKLPPEEILDLATGGVCLAGSSQVEKVILVPQYHAAPVNIYEHYRELLIIFYPVELRKPEKDAPPQKLLRLTAALSDQSRLKILRHLSGRGESSFSEIVSFSKLAKSTVHHHLITLRAAGLVGITFYDDSNITYRFRSKALEQVNSELQDYIK